MCRLDTFDLSQIQEFFITEVGRVEDAGGGCVRVINCVRRGDRLTPVFAVVVPIDSLIIAGTVVRDRATEIFNDNQLHGALN